MDLPMDYRVWNTMLGYYQRHMTKLANVMPRWRTVWSTIENDLLYEFIDKKFVSFATDFDRVLLQLLGTDIENSLFKYRVSYRHLIFMLKHLNCWWKAVKNLICYSCIFNMQLHVHLKKWTLKFKLLYLRNYISYFNKICSICWANTHIQRLKVWLKSVQSWLKYSIFSRGLFFIGAPCIARSSSACLSVCLCVRHALVLLLGGTWSLL